MEEAKRRRYDRQLRIWGEHGQARLESCKVCLLHCGPTGVETIKNLVLGGIHSFTLVDDAVVTPRDLGNNFFVHESDLGKGRAAAVAARLHELNTSVSGAFVDESVDVVVDQNPDFFAAFDVVVASRVPMKTLAKLDEACRARDVALVALDALGLMGTVRLSKREHHVLEAKPEETDFDLRVNAPWPALIEFADRFASSGAGGALTETQRAHIPWAVTLVNVVEGLGMRDAPASAWTADRRAAAKAAIKAALRPPAALGAGDGVEAEAMLAALGDAALPENATEALAAARHAWKPPGAVPPALAKTLSDPKLDALDADAPMFWFLLAGLRAFLRGEGEGEGGDGGGAASRDVSSGVMPLEGSIPDMTSTTEWYVALQRLYREKADADADDVLLRARAFLRAAGKPEAAVTAEEARFFCKHAAHARAVRWRSVADERVWADGAGEALAAQLADPDATVAWCAARYVVARAVDVFRETRGRYPGAPPEPVAAGAAGASGDIEMRGAETMPTTSCDVDADVASLRSIVQTTLGAIGVEAGGARTGDLKAMAVEAARCAGGELHAVAAVLGGVGAQEVIKLVTGQFEPEAHTLVYDAAKAVTAAVL